MRSASTLFLACFVYIAYARPSDVPEISSLVTSMTGPELADSSHDGAIPTAATPGLRRGADCSVACLNERYALVNNLKAEHTTQITAKDVQMNELKAQHKTQMTERNEFVINLKAEHTTQMTAKDDQMNELKAQHTTQMNAKDDQMNELKAQHTTQMNERNAFVQTLNQNGIDNKQQLQNVLQNWK